MIFFDVGAACILIVVFESPEDIGDGQANGSEFVGIDRHLVLLDIASEAVDFDYAGHHSHLAFNDPVLDGSQVGSTVLLPVSGIHLEGVLQNFTEACGDGPHGRVAKSRGDIFPHFGKFFGHQLTGQEGAHVIFKNNGYHGKPEAGDGAYFHYAGQVGHSHFHRVGYELFDVFSAQIGRLGDHLHLVVGDVGHGI